MKIGYIRISTKDQNEDLQADALNKAGCKKIFRDIGVSGSTAERKGLTEALEYLREGDTLVCWKLDRVFRSIKHLIQLTEDLKKRNIEFLSLQDNIDTSSPGGRLMFHIIGSIAEFERDLIRERTKAGLEAARARGRKGGRPRKLSEIELSVAKSLFADKSKSIKEITDHLKISKSTLYKNLKLK